MRRPRDPGDGSDRHPLRRPRAEGFDLGAPVGSEYAPTTGGLAQDYQFGTIFWSAGTGAHEVQGAILAKYRTFGGPPGLLGYPLTAESRTPDGVGRFNHFAGTGGSSIYWTPATRAHEVQGAIRAKWAALGWEAGRLGYPITDEYAIPNGRRNDFVHGTIRWSGLNGTIVVSFG